MVDRICYENAIRVVCKAFFCSFPLAIIQACKFHGEFLLSAQQEFILVLVCISYLMHFPFWDRSFALQRHWHSLHNHERIKLSKELFKYGLVLIPADFISAGFVFSVIRNAIFDQILNKISCLTIFVVLLGAMVLIQASANVIWTSLRWLLGLATLMNSEDVQEDSTRNRCLVVAIVAINVILLLGCFANIFSSWHQCSKVGSMILLGISASSMVIFNIFLLDSRKITFPHFTPITESSLIETFAILKEMTAYLITYAFILLIQGGTLVFGCSSIEPTNYVSFLLVCWPTGAVLLLTFLTLFRYSHIQRNMETERIKQSVHAVELEKKIIPKILDLETQDTLTDRCCAICLEEYFVSDEIFSTKSCKHVYHFRCIKTWFQQSRDTCPTCRTAIEF